jgi:hypothetical protein
MIMVAHDRYEPEFTCERLDDLKSLFRVIAPMEDIAKVHYNIDGTEVVGKFRIFNTCAKNGDCRCISMHIGKYHETHNG